MNGLQADVRKCGEGNNLSSGTFLTERKLTFKKPFLPLSNTFLIIIKNKITIPQTWCGDFLGPLFVGLDL